MIKEHGELYTRELEHLIFECPEYIAKPRRRKPWPVLKVEGKSGGKEGRKMDPPLGVIDEGSDHEGTQLNPLETVLVDSDGDEESESDGEDVASNGRLGIKGMSWIPTRDFFESGPKPPARRHVFKKRVYPKTGLTRVFVKPPSALHSMTLADVEKDADKNSGSDAEEEEERAERAGVEEKECAQVRENVRIPAGDEEHAADSKGPRDIADGKDEADQDRGI